MSDDETSADSSPPSAATIQGEPGADLDDSPDAAPDTIADDATSAPARWRKVVRRILFWTAIVMAVVLAIVAVLAIWPTSTSGLGSDPDPTTTYDDAVALFEQVTADEGENVFEPCRSQLLDHGEATDEVVVLFHGLTNCPEQFQEFGTELYDQGANVLILRAPRHGLANSAGDGIGGVSNVDGLTASELVDYADNSIDIATGLGDEVKVLGLSMGGVLANWTAQERSDVDRVIAVAPAMSIPGMPSFLTTGFINLFHKIPAVDLPGESNLDHAYAGESTKGLVATFTIARAVETASDVGPAAKDVIVVVNPNDNQVDPDVVTGFAESWGSDGVPIVLLPDAGLPHDVIDPDQPAGDPELVYPILIDLLQNGR